MDPVALKNISLFHLPHFPQELVVKIFSSLDNISLVRASRTCHLFHTIANTHFFSKQEWKNEISKYIIEKIPPIQSSLAEKIIDTQQILTRDVISEILGKTPLDNFYSPTDELTAHELQVNDLLAKEVSFQTIKSYKHHAHLLESQTAKIKRKICCCIAFKNTLLICTISLLYILAIVIVAIPKKKSSNETIPLSEG